MAPLIGISHPVKTSQKRHHSKILQLLDRNLKSNFIGHFTRTHQPRNLKLKQKQAQPISISEVEDAKCEGCVMCEECTPEYVKRVGEKFSEAVKEEVEKNGKKLEKVLRAHVYTCARLNRLSRAYHVLCQADAMREMFKKNMAKSLNLWTRVLHHITKVASVGAPVVFRIISMETNTLDMV